MRKDGTTRFCVDYRHLNDVSQKESFPLPRVDLTLDALNGSQWFSTLDLTKEQILAGQIGRISKGENSVLVRKRTVAV